MTRPAYVQRPSIAVAYLQLLVEILGARGIPAGRLFAGLPGSAALLERPDGRMSAEQWTRLVLRGLELTGDPALGYEYGLRMRPSVHGVLGFATLTAPTLRQALELSARYTRVRQGHFVLQLVEDGARARLEVREKFPIPVLRSFFYENVLLGLVRGHAVLLGRELADMRDVELWFDWPEPPYHAAWRDRLPPVRFARPVNALVFPAQELLLRPVLADPHASQQAIALCERELALAAGEETDTAMRVRALLVPRTQGGYPGLEEVAARLHMSARTLKRHLRQGGTGFLLLLEEARRRDALDLLAHTGLPVQAIAVRLGYRNPANFSRAFVQWTGEAPTACRRRLRGD